MRHTSLYAWFVSVNQKGHWMINSLRACEWIHKYIIVIMIMNTQMSLDVYLQTHDPWLIQNMSTQLHRQTHATTRYKHPHSSTDILFLQTDTSNRTVCPLVSRPLSSLVSPLGPWSAPAKCSGAPFFFPQGCLCLAKGLYSHELHTPM